MNAYPNPHSSKSRSRLKRILLIDALMILPILAFLLYRIGPFPTLEAEFDRPGVGQAPMQIEAEIAEPKRGLSRVQLELIQGDDVHTLVEESFTPPAFWAFWQKGQTQHTLAQTLTIDDLPKKAAGEITLRLTAQGVGTPLRHPRTTVETWTMPVKLTPPDLSVISSPNYAKQGGSGLVVYRVDDAALEIGGRDGVQAGSWFFPGYPVDPNQPQKRFALFAAPYDLSDESKILLVAGDAFGNESRQRFLDRYFEQPLKTDTIQVSDRFFEKVVPEIMAQTPEFEDRGDLLQNYVGINRDLRRQNAESLVAMAKESPSEWLWSGAFVQLPNSQVTSSFADRRTYIYNGEKVDQQDHLGFDLASVRQAEIPASNSGIVRLARYFGIYGKTVVVDHGFGLMTLYSHLSSIEVEEGQQVEKGQSLGRSGETGLAAGDHLHFTMMIHGLAVNPIEWWDKQWIQHRILDSLK